MMQPRIETIKEKKLVGKKLKMSFAHNKTGELWAGFMPRRKEIKNSVSTDLFSLQIYEKEHFNKFNPEREFEKWALVEVSSFDNIPEGFESFSLQKGLYAVFHYKGSSADSSIFQYIFATWLPSSDYALDDRPHFEILDEKYKNNDPDSEEEIWIPVKPK